MQDTSIKGRKFTGATRPPKTASTTGASSATHTLPPSIHASVDASSRPTPEPRRLSTNPRAPVIGALSRAPNHPVSAVDAGRAYALGP